MAAAAGMAVAVGMAAGGMAAGGMEEAGMAAAGVGAGTEVAGAPDGDGEEAGGAVILITAMAILIGVGAAVTGVAAGAAVTGDVVTTGAVTTGAVTMGVAVTGAAVTRVAVTLGVEAAVTGVSESRGRITANWRSIPPTEKLARPSEPRLLRFSKLALGSCSCR